MEVSRGTYSQAPGLSVLNARSSQPAAGSMVTSRLTGLLPFSMDASKAYLVCDIGAASGERPTTRKSCPYTKSVSRHRTGPYFGLTYVEMNRMRETETSFRVILNKPVYPLANVLTSKYIQRRGLEMDHKLTWSTASTPQTLFVSG